MFFRVEWECVKKMGDREGRTPMVTSPQMTRNGNGNGLGGMEMGSIGEVVFDAGGKTEHGDQGFR